MCERILPLLPQAKNLVSLKLHMSGRVEQRQARCIPPANLRRLAQTCREKLPELKSLTLPDFHLDASGLLLDVIDTLMAKRDFGAPGGGKSKLEQLALPERVSRQVAVGGGAAPPGFQDLLGGAGGSLPFVGDLSRLGPNSKYV